ncbi:MAG: cobalamin biosynthesis protein CobD [Leptolyngbya sp. SIO1E4]|nr:cobalamin biosynthesis protein CobD [Leptolyngbya sp. SIO1E4]
MPVLWCSLPVVVPLLAAIADFIIGDPWHWIHPVQVMGWGIQAYQTLIFKYFQSPRMQRLAGVMLGLGLPVLSGAIAGGVVSLAARFSPLLGAGVAVVTLASCFAGRSLRRAAEDVLAPLSQGDLPEARGRLSLYVGRDTETLSEPEILRAVMETISENATDGVLAPLFYALLGTAIAPEVGVAFAIAYKALSTLDSMVGYRSAPYTYLGWFSARAEDLATWIPCRLTVLTIALLSGRPGYVWHTCQQDAPADPSPNAGWSECAYAASLGVQLGGMNTYRGQIRKKPLLGSPHRPIDCPVIRQSLRLTRWACVIWLTLGLMGLGFRYGLNCG